MRPMTFATNKSNLQLDARGGRGRYIQLGGPLLHPEIETKPTSLVPVEN
jgi:hypothetical protein